MNVVVLSHRLPFPPNKGEKIRTYNQLEHLRQCGFNITVFCPIDSEVERESAQQYAASTGVTIKSVDSGFRKLTMLAGLFSGRAFSVSNFYSRALQVKFDTYLLENSVDAIYCTSSAMAEYLFKSQLPVRSATSTRAELIDFMDLDSDKWRQYRKISRFPMSLIYRYEESTLSTYEKKIQQRFDACIFISENEVALFRKKLANSADNLRVVGNGVDLNAFKPRKDVVVGSSRNGRELKLLFSGVMDYLPNENAMLWFVDQVWSQLKETRPEAELVIAGMNPSQSIQALADKDGITVTGYVDDMLSCYHNATVFVAPFQIARGVQNKILQSFACGLPVVTTKVGAEGIDSVAGTHYVLAESPQEFIDGIVRLAENQEYYDTMSAVALQLVNEKFTWEAMNTELFGLFNRSAAA